MSQRKFWSKTVAVCLASAPLMAAAAGKSDPSLAQLQEEMRETKALLLQMIQQDQKRNELMMKVLEQNGGGAASSTERATEAPSRPEKTERTEKPKAARKAAAPKESTGTVSGRVNFQGRHEGDAYVYIQDIKGSSAKGQNIEIQQKDKQFWPRSIAVQRGTKLTFANYDAIFHNVFSLTPNNKFDLGAYQAGEAPRSVVMTQPGVVDVFCNMHSGMSASVLVVPNSHFAKVKPDGSYSLPGVPVGQHRVVAWMPNAEAQSQDITISESGGSANFALQSNEPKQHTNKFGQPYGSYGD